MKILKLNTTGPVKTAENFIKAILLNDRDAFRATSRQFLRNNQAYFPQLGGMIA